MQRCMSFLSLKTHPYLTFLGLTLVSGLWAACAQQPPDLNGRVGNPPPPGQPLLPDKPIGTETTCKAGQLHAFQSPPLLIPISESNPIGKDYLGFPLDENFQPIKNVGPVMEGARITQPLKRARIHTKLVTDTVTFKAVANVSKAIPIGKKDLLAIESSATLNSVSQMAYSEVMYRSHMDRFDASAEYDMEKITAEQAYVVTGIVYGAGHRLIHTDKSNTNAFRLSVFTETKGEEGKVALEECTEQAVAAYKTLFDSYEIKHQDAKAELTEYKEENKDELARKKEAKEVDPLLNDLIKDVRNAKKTSGYYQGLWETNVMCAQARGKSVGGSGGFSVTFDYLRSNDLVDTHFEPYGVSPRTDMSILAMTKDDIVKAWGTAVDGQDYVAESVLVQPMPTFRCVTAIRPLPVGPSNDLVLVVHSITPTRGASVQSYGFWGQHTDQPQWKTFIKLGLGYQEVGKSTIWKDPVDVRNGQESQMDFTFRVRNVPSKPPVIRFGGTHTTTRRKQDGDPEKDLASLRVDLKDVMKDLAPGEEMSGTWNTGGRYETGYQVRYTLIRLAN